MAGPRTFSVPSSFLGSGLVNLAINAPLGLVVVPRGGSLPLLGLRSIAADTVAMAFGIAFGTALVVTLQTRAAVRKGKLRPPELSPKLRASLGAWPRGLLQRSVNLGVLSVIAFAPLPLLALWALDVHELSREAFIAWKGGLAFVQGGVVTPLVVIAAMIAWPAPSDPPPAPSDAQHEPS